MSGYFDESEWIRREIRRQRIWEHAVEELIERHQEEFDELIELEEVMDIIEGRDDE